VSEGADKTTAERLFIDGLKFDSTVSKSAARTRCSDAQMVGWSVRRSISKGRPDNTGKQRH
jgi:hypothetical protein